jgi:uncharacterized protein YndB with AHSA1/START domain
VTDHFFAHPTFSLERFYPALADRVFAASADPAAKARWFGGGEHQLYFQVGGREVYRGRLDGASVLTFESVYHEISSGDRIVYCSTLSAGGTVSTVSITTVEFSAAGLLLGGVIATSLGWQWIFLVNVPVAIALLVASPAVAPKDTGHGGRRLDAAGALTFTGALLIVAYLIITIPDVGWMRWHTAGLTAAALALVAHFWFIETHTQAPAGVAASLTDTAFALGTALGVAITTTTALATVHAHAVLHHASAGAAAGLLSGAYRWAFAATAAFAVFGLASAWLLNRSQQPPRPRPAASSVAGATLASQEGQQS